jgi:signal peptidase I
MGENQVKEKNGMLEMIFDVVSILATACIAVTLAFLFLFRTVGVNGGSMEPTLYTNDRIILTARFDNLGKGASGAAIQCLNLVMGCEEDKGLNL